MGGLGDPWASSGDPGGRLGAPWGAWGDPKGSPQGVTGTPREDKIAHRRSKIAEIYENAMVSYYFLRPMGGRILEMCVSRKRNNYFL